MRGSSLRPPLAVPVLLRFQARTATSSSHYICRQCVVSPSISTTFASRRSIQISSAPATSFPKPGASDAFGAPADGTRDESDARFEVLGSPYSLLSVSLSASQNLYTRRGTLVSVAGKVENAQSTLALLAPVRRALLGIPFLYQRISSTTPLTLLIATRAATTTLFNLRLDGTTDWVVAQRGALLAWTGHTLAVTPRRTETRGLGLAHWGTSFVTGRGLVALAAPGYIYPVTLAAGEELVVHPSHVVAYAVSKSAAPQPFRFRSAASPAAGAVAAATKATAGAVSSAAAATAQVGTKALRSLHLQAPAVAANLPPAVSRFWHAMRGTATYKLAARALFDARTALRRAVWGDRLFVHVRGPTTLLLSSRGVGVADALTRDDVNEIADAEAGAVPAAVERAAKKAEKGEKGEAAEGKESASTTSSSTVAIHVATVKPDGKVEFTDAKDLKEFVR